MMTKIFPFPTTKLLMSEALFSAWLGQAEPGEDIEYHRGFLAVDTIRAGRLLAEPERKELVRLARRAFWASDKRLVHLIQQRLGPERFSYLAIARKRPKSMHAALLRELALGPETGGFANPNTSLRRASL